MWVRKIGYVVWLIDFLLKFYSIEYKFFFFIFICSKIFVKECRNFFDFELLLILCVVFVKFFEDFGFLLGWWFFGILVVILGLWTFVWVILEVVNLDFGLLLMCFGFEFFEEMVLCGFNLIVLYFKYWMVDCVRWCLKENVEL